MGISEEEKLGFVEMMREVEATKLDNVRKRAEQTFGSNLGSAYFEYAHAGIIERTQNYPENFDWAGRRLSFARAVVEALETGSREEKVLAFTAVLKSFEVQSSDHTK